MASIVVIGLASTPALADDVETAAQVHLDRGVAAYGAADWTVALQEFRAASALVPYKPNPYRWLALTEVQLGDCAHARLDVESFIARVPIADPRVGELVQMRDGCVQRGGPSVVADPVAAQRGAPMRVDRPLVTRWWFWTIIGSVAVVAVGTTLYATHDDGPTLLPAIVCGPTGCR